VLIGATAAAGVATAVLAFVTDWSGGSTNHEVAVAPTSGGAVFAFGGRF